VTGESSGPQASIADVAPWPWRLKRSRVQVGALILITLVALGPFVALVVTLKAPTDPSRVMLEVGRRSSTVTDLDIALLSLDPVAGEIRARITPLPAAALVENGNWRVPVSFSTNDSAGGRHSAAAGDLVTPFEMTIRIERGTFERYPFDAYRARILLVASQTPSAEPNAQPEPLPVTLTVRSTAADFRVSARRELLSGQSSAVDAPAALAVVGLEADRPLSTTVYAVWLMALMWALAVAGVLIAWSLMIWQIDVPVWAFGYFVGVLFALPPLRNSLPGRPPPGTLVDFVSFYWAITIVGVLVVLVLGMWLRRARFEVHQVHLQRLVEEEERRRLNAE
jgi:hypothetical protein